MIAAKLKSPAEAAKKIAEIFRAEILENGSQCIISVRDEGAFMNDEWLQLGTICFPSSTPESADKKEAYLTESVKLGAFEWSTPAIATVRKNLLKLLDENKSQPNIDGVLGNIASIAVRAGLLRPLFDPVTLEEMPFSRSTTIVADTSGVLQGGLDFVAQHLHPAARVKIPAIVHMELVASADNFFNLRRKRKSPPRQLIEHLKSQGGQRTLLRLELQADTEIERTFLLGDPLRNAFRTDKNSGLSGLNITIPNKSYADRLILEAARHHQAQSSPSHQVRLLTSDQGLARMALAEGIAPLYFLATKATDFFETRLTGRTFDPFTGKVQEISLASVLWELATAFGSARLESKNGGTTFTVSALGEEMSWSPYHSIEDLLWCASMVPSDESSVAIGHEAVVTPKSELVPQKDKPVPTHISKSTRKITFFRFDVGRLFRLICALDDNQAMTIDQIVEVLEIKNASGTDEYRRFLLSADLIYIEGETWKVKILLSRLSADLRNERVREVHDVLHVAPSYAEFVSFIADLKIGQTLKCPQLGRGARTYRVLGELTLTCVEIQGEGIYPTPSVPSATEFAPLALSRYSELEKGGDLVASGAWLEALIRKDGIHPENARLRLNEASEKGILRRSTEGSTMQIRQDDHKFHVLRVRSGMPTVVPIHLYRGDYLIPGKASVSLRIEEVNQ